MNTFDLIGSFNDNIEDNYNDLEILKDIKKQIRKEILRNEKCKPYYSEGQKLVELVNDRIDAIKKQQEEAKRIADEPSKDEALQALKTSRALSFTKAVKNNDNEKVWQIYRNVSLFKDMDDEVVNKGSEIIGKKFLDLAGANKNVDIETMSVALSTNGLISAQTPAPTTPSHVVIVNEKPKPQPKMARDKTRDKVAFKNLENLDRDKLLANVSQLESAMKTSNYGEDTFDDFRKIIFSIFPEDQNQSKNSMIQDPDESWTHQEDDFTDLPKFERDFTRKSIKQLKHQASMSTNIKEIQDIQNEVVNRNENSEEAEDLKKLAKDRTGYLKTINEIKRISKRMDFISEIKHYSKSRI